MYFILGWINSSTPPATNSNLLVDAQLIKNDNRLEISDSYQGDSLPERVREETHYITGSVSHNGATEIIVLQYTVPTGRTFRLLGYTVTGNDLNNINCSCRITLTAPPTTDPVSPGVVDGPEFLVSQLTPVITGDLTENFSANPIQFAGAGQTVYLTMTQSAPPETVLWRARMDFVLRS